MNILNFLPEKQNETLELIDNACNSTGLLNSLINIHSQLRDYKLISSTDDINNHPITRFFLQKLISMTVFDYISTNKFIELRNDLKIFGEYLKTCVSTKNDFTYINGLCVELFSKKVE